MIIIQGLNAKFCPPQDSGAGVNAADRLGLLAERRQAQLQGRVLPLRPHNNQGAYICPQAVGTLTDVYGRSLDLEILLKQPGRDKVAYIAACDFIFGDTTAE